MTNITWTDEEQELRRYILGIRERKRKEEEERRRDEELLLTAPQMAKKVELMYCYL